MYKGLGRWKGVLKVGGQAEGRFSLPLGHRVTNSGAVLSVSDRDAHNPQVRSRQPLVAVWHPTNSD